MVLQGRILKSISGFYEVEAEGQLYTCKARGVFRKTGTTPLVGDLVCMSADDVQTEGTVDEILPRRNALSRPPVANLDNLFIVVSVCEPVVYHWAPSAIPVVMSTVCLPPPLKMIPVTPEGIVA